jgi:isoleucyl-tRNA synthetase
VEGREASVHLALFLKPEEVFAGDFTESFKEWKILFRARDVVLKHLEEARKNKEIGKALEADIQITSSSEVNKIFLKYESSLKELFNVSKVEIVPAIIDQETLEVISNLEDNEICTQFRPAAGHKCARCWNFMPEVSSYGIWQNVCTRCQSALTEMGIQPPQQPQTEEAAS